MDLPAHVQAALGVVSPISENDLSDAADAWPFTQSAFGLSGKEFAEAAAVGHAGVMTIAVSQPVLVSKTSWRYFELSKNGTQESWFISTPDTGNGLPPTEVGKALTKAWMQHSKIFGAADITPGLLVQGTPSGVANSRFASRLASEWAGVCFLLERTLVPPTWVVKNDMNVLVNARLDGGHGSNLKYENLLLEAVSESKIKWRFLSLYRILEHGYLDEIYNTLTASFFASPKQSLKNASQQVESEVNQFQALVDKANLLPPFEMLYDEFDYAVGGGNRFAGALFNSIDHKAKKWVKGVLVCYRIRCAIVHAGLSAPIFDAYPDGPELLEIILPTFETISLSFLGVTIG